MEQKQVKEQDGAEAMTAAEAISFGEPLDRQKRAKLPSFPQEWQEALRAGHNDRFRWVSRLQKKHDTALTTGENDCFVQTAVPESLAFVSQCVITDNDWSGADAAGVAMSSVEVTN